MVWKGRRTKSLLISLFQISNPNRTNHTRCSFQDFWILYLINFNQRLQKPMTEKDTAQKVSTNPLFQISNPNHTRAAFKVLCLIWSISGKVTKPMTDNLCEKDATQKSSTNPPFQISNPNHTRARFRDFWYLIWSISTKVTKPMTNNLFGFEKDTAQSPY